MDCLVVLFALLITQVEAECMNDVSIYPNDSLIITESVSATLSCTAPCRDQEHPIQNFVKPSGHDILQSFGNFAHSTPTVVTGDICTYSLNISWPRETSDQDQILGVNLVQCLFLYHNSGIESPQIPSFCYTRQVRVIFDRGITATTEPENVTELPTVPSVDTGSWEDLGTTIMLTDSTTTSGGSSLNLQILNLTLLLPFILLSLLWSFYLFSVI